MQEEMEKNIEHNTSYFRFHPNLNFTWPATVWRLQNEEQKSNDPP